MPDVWSAVAASGPLALVLGFACLQLWRKLEAMEKKIDAKDQQMFDLLKSLAAEARENDGGRPNG